MLILILKHQTIRFTNAIRAKIRHCALSKVLAEFALFGKMPSLLSVSFKC